MSSLTSFESILILSARLVGNFNATPALVGVLKKIDIRPLIEPVMSGLHSIGAIEVVNVCEASLMVCQQIGDVSSASLAVATYSVATFSSPGRAAILKVPLLWELTLQSKIKDL